MSSTTLSIDGRVATWSTRLVDLCELTRPRIGVMVLVTVAAAALVASWGQPNPWLLLQALAATFLVAGSASATNQWLERERDLRMDRTRNRPLPSGRLSSRSAFLFSASTLVAGSVWLALACNLLAAIMAALSWLVYVALYTPLKARTAWNTAVGAVSGALPVWIGWTAVGGSLDPRVDARALALFALLFLWQFPHFMAIAWKYRGQYGKAEIKMLTVTDPTGRRAGMQAVVAALALLPVSFVPALSAVGTAAALYVLLAFLLGVGQLVCAISFFASRSDTSARRLLRASLIYLPLILLVQVLLPLV